MAEEAKRSTSSRDFRTLQLILRRSQVAENAVASRESWFNQRGEHIVEQIISDFYKPAPIDPKKIELRF